MNISLSNAASARASPLDDAQAARLALRCLDLTSLRDDDSAASIEALAARADTPHGAPAALCIYPAWLGCARRALDQRGLGAVKLATVVNFPHGESAAAAVADETRLALVAGTDEIDVVLPWRALRAGDASSAEHLLRTVRKACDAGRGDRPGLVLKVILETGELSEPALITRASRIALAAGADFLKTSTGKTRHQASPQAAALMLAAIAAHGRRAGLKVSGGVGSIADVQVYLALAATVYGTEGLSPATLRFGASSLLPALLAVLDAQGSSSKHAGGARAAR